MFSPKVDQQIVIAGLTYTVVKHPAAPSFPYAQEGRAATVFKMLRADSLAFALKVFKPAYRKPLLAGQAPKLAKSSHLSGLKVCKRTVLSPLRSGDLIKQHPDLLYAVVMPWIRGATWHDVIAQKRPLTPEQSLFLACSFAQVFTGMEEHGIAHCDISAANVLLPGLDATSSNGFAVELVDVEQLYASDMQRPNPLIAGTPGYLPQDLTGVALWNVTGDRFAGAVLLAELLGWCDERVRAAAYEGSYFRQDEMQADSQRYRTLLTVLQEHWGPGIAKRFSSAWKSQSLVECPLFGDWLVNLPDTVPEYQTTTTVIPAIDDSIFEAEKDPAGSEESTQSSAPPSSVDDLIALAQQYEQQKDWTGAIKVYRQALELLPSESGLAREIQGIIRGLELKSGEDGKNPPKVSWRWLLAGGMAILAIVAFLVTRNSQPLPVVPTATSAIALVQATATETLIPATNTPSPTNTATPRPTNTPSATPTSEPSYEPMIYDDFEEVSAAKSFDRLRWELLGENHFTVTQEDGVLVFTSTDLSASGGVDLRLRSPRQRNLQQLQFFEAALKMEDYHRYAFVKIQIVSDNINGHGWWTQCRLSSASFICDIATFDDSGIGFEYSTPEVGITPNTWYNVRIEVDINTSELAFYLDSQLVDRYIPNDAEFLLKATNFTPQVGIWSVSSAKRYIDNVRITSDQ